ncbi:MULTISPECIES: hypothetical protein [Rhodococcus]|nr:MULTISPECIES: hypothetical protein [Rhodococcus]MDV7246356.1 hypothetical protein [Rhodococcus oxybenzonivorans]MDV7337362.1 hypothetical protein [Rhodococcus oxybenzonivorans]MDV7347991.1 hypothetical protein [Rhodococcus oxybenzonivorans]MDV8031643.1 hypothetical protein [Rhodococcus sp. IEGM 27]
MSASGPNPVLAPIRRWVLYSRTHLAITVAGAVALLFAAGAVFGEPPPPRAVAHEADTTVEPVTPAETISYDLDEVTESLVVAKTAAWAASSAPATAMAYAHAFVNTAPSDSLWANTIGRHTADKLGEHVVAARPRTPVAITGPTVSTLTDEPDGTKAARVTIPTQAGDLRITVTVDEANGEKRWVVDTPLPTLDLSEVENIAPPTTATPRTSTPPTTTATDTTQPQPIPTSSPSTTPQPAVDLDEPTTAASRGNDPTPVPGPIPIPELDTPIPGGR